MQIQINTSDNIKGSEAMIARFSAVLDTSLDRFSDRVTHLEVYLRDENGTKGGPEDKHCTIEARLEGLQPMTVTDHAATLERAVDGASHKIANLIEHTLGRLHDRDRRHASPSA
ncbi:MAG: HPF/RaiA family ribosome-associated protein [Devosia sp.]